MPAANPGLRKQAIPRLSLPDGGIAPAAMFWLSLGFVLFGIALRLLVFGLDFPVWRDEASLSFNFLQWDYRRLLGELDNRQIAPLLFLWIEKTVCVLAGPSEYCLRLVPLLAGVGGLILFWRLARTLLSPLAVAFAVGILAVSWSPVELASTIKPYAIDLFVSVLLLHLAVAYLRRSDGRRYLVLLTLVAPLAVGLSYASVFVAGAVSLVLAPFVCRKSWGDRGWFLAFNVLLLTAFVAHLLFVGRPIDPARPSGLNAYMRQYWSQGFPHGGPWGWLGWVVRVHLRSLFVIPVDFKGSGVLVIGLGVLGACSLARQGLRSVALLCLLPFALHLLAALLQRFPYGATRAWNSTCSPVSGCWSAPALPRSSSASRERLPARHAGWSPGLLALWSSALTWP